eukprot:Awhi_evm1s15476
MSSLYDKLSTRVTLFHRLKRGQSFVPPPKVNQSVEENNVSGGPQESTLQISTNITSNDDVPSSSHLNQPEEEQQSLSSTNGNQIATNSVTTSSAHPETTRNNKLELLTTIMAPLLSQPHFLANSYMPILLFGSAATTIFSR